eukprot:2753506-Alexandrium_andersonii.AAC.1
MVLDGVGGAFRGEYTCAQGVSVTFLPRATFRSSCSRSSWRTLRWDPSTSSCRPGLARPLPHVAVAVPPPGRDV